ncbi:DUF2785 domain-containing protein [Chungangia koreensis]|uniref:DUF2785 domain-containing protein n=1 Tax=Chungangia koreensis TaxID=752657 RepID=A0ABV8X6J2_9LACT
MNLMKELEGFLQKEPIHNLSDLLTGMAENIGSTDPYLRDQLIYRSYYHLIFDGHLKEQELHQLMKTMLEEDFFHHRLGEQNTDSVFRRSFSALVIALLIEYDFIHHVFEQGEIENAADQAIHYMMNEQDYRGYVDDKGWAHAVAHCADVLDAMAKHPMFTNIERLLTAIEVPLFSRHAFTDDEEERLAIPVLSLLMYKQAEVEISSWLSRLIDRTERHLQEQRGAIESYRVQYTIKNFLKALYFSLKFKDQSPVLQNEINKQLMKWSHF